MLGRREMYNRGGQMLGRREMYNRGGQMLGRRELMYNRGGQMLGRREMYNRGDRSSLRKFRSYLALLLILTATNLTTADRRFTRSKSAVKFSQ